MPYTNKPLPIECPKCHHDGCTLVVRSLTVMMVTCANCHHTWATDVDSLSVEIQERIHAVLKDQ